MKWGLFLGGKRGEKGYVPRRKEGEICVIMERKTPMIL